MTASQLSVAFFLQMFFILAACRGVGWIAQRCGQPQVVGEMVAGVMLGPSLFGLFWPQAQQALFPPDSMKMLYVGAQLGVGLYMFLVGVEFRTELFKSRIRSAVSVSVAGMIVPFIIGTGLALWLIKVPGLFSEKARPFEAALYLGAAIAITAFPMLARIIYERGLTGTALGTLALAAGAIDDAAAWCVLAVVLASFGGGAGVAVLAIAVVNGQVYAQPLVWHNVLLAVTQTNWIYGLDPVTGARQWARNVAVPWNASDIPCGAILPKIGITGTPVIDTATGTAYFLAKTYARASSGPAAYWIHAVDSSTGKERSNFPVRIQGTAQNDPSVTFNPTPQLQRPGLLLMNGVVYAAFGSLCDLSRYQGWIVGVSTSGKIKAMWSAVHSPVTKGAGIWQSGGGIVSDGPRQIIVTTGNGGTPTDVAPGNKPPPSLGEAVVRLEVQPGGQLTPTDFFTPSDAPALDAWDGDLGSGAPMGLPPAYFGTHAYPRLAVQVGKQGYVYLLDLTNLGGKSQGSGGSDLVVNRLGPYDGVWAKPAVWPGNGGYVYIPTTSGGARDVERGPGPLNVFKYGLDDARKPTLRLVATSTAAFKFGSSAPVVTSNGAASGSALVWIVWMSGSGSPVAGIRPRAGARPPPPALARRDRHCHEVRDAGSRQRTDLRRHPRRPRARLRRPTRVARPEVSREASGSRRVGPARLGCPPCAPSELLRRAVARPRLDPWSRSTSPAYGVVHRQRSPLVPNQAALAPMMYPQLGSTVRSACPEESSPQRRTLQAESPRGRSR